MPTHRIRLKAPWLVSAHEKGQPVAPPSGTLNSKLELPALLEQLLSSRTEPLDVQATRRFHRPTGLTNSSSISVAITSQRPPDRVLFGPIAPGSQASDQLEELPASRGKRNGKQDCFEFVLPQELQLRNELQLQWTQLHPECSLESLSVELVIHEPDSI